MLFLFVVLLFVIFLHYLSKSRKIQLSFVGILVAFMLKVAAGCAFGYVYLHSSSGKDTWEYHQASLFEYKWMMNDFGGFVKSIFPSGTKATAAKNFFDSENSYWKDLPYSILIKMLAIFNVVSKGNYYLNVVLYNAITIWGHYFLFSLVSRYFGKKQLLYLIIFCFPPLLFWVSGIHKDGLIFTFLTASFYFFNRCIYSKTKTVSCVLTCISLLFLVLFRSLVGLTLIPFLVAYAITNFSKKPPVLIFGLTVITCLICFVASSFAPSHLNLPQKFAERQHAFLLLKGRSYMHLEPLTSNISSYIKLLPTAFNHSFIRPFFTECNNMLQFTGAVETYFVLLMLAIAIIHQSKQRFLNHPLLLLFLFFSVINYLLIGYSVPFSGAIVRYRISFEILLIIVFLLKIDMNNFITIRLEKTGIMKYFIN